MTPEERTKAERKWEEEYRKTLRKDKLIIWATGAGIAAVSGLAINILTYKDRQPKLVTPQITHEEIAPEHNKSTIVFEGQEPDKNITDIKSIDVQKDQEGNYRLKFHYLKPHGERATQ